MGSPRDRNRQQKSRDASQNDRRSRNIHRTEKEGIFVYGRRPVEELLRLKDAARWIDRAYIAESLPRELHRKISAIVEQERTETLNRHGLDDLAGGGNHQGVLLRLHELPAAGATSLKEILREKKGLVLVLDRIQDPHNLGSIVRSAEALGAAAVIVTGSGAKITPAVHRVSAGATFHIPVIIQSNPDQVIREAKKEGYWIVISDAPLDEDSSSTLADSTVSRENIGSDNAGETSHKQALWISSLEVERLPSSSDLLLLIGSEGEGARSLLKKRADFIISIPLSGKIASLNAGVAAALLMDRIIHRP